MNIFDKEFYPTPKEVINQMMENECVYGKRVLEPSAGKGDIVDWLWEAGAEDVIACETDPNLRKLLQDKCPIVCDDFLKLRSEDVSHIDYIVMNPPFSKANEHILHAWDIAPSGCIIIALRGVEGTSHWNPLWKKSDDEEYEEKMRRAKFSDEMDDVLEYNGTVKSLGRCFKDAERPADIEIEMLKLYKQGTKDNEWEGYFDAEEDLGELAAGTEGIMKYDAVRDVVNRYRMAVDMWDEAMEKANRINELVGSFSKYGVRFKAIKGTDNYSVVWDKKEFKKMMQRDAWNWLFENINMQRYVTAKVREKITLFIETQQTIPFTMKNIYLMLDCIVQTHGQRMEECIAEAFDEICRLSSDNSTAGEKWRTNLNYMVNRRIISPWGCSGYDRYTRQSLNAVYIEYNSNAILNDFITAINYIAGPGRETPKITHDINRMKLSFGKWYDWGEFRIRFYKKGTIHMEFKDEKLWQEFNRRAAKQKGWTLSDNTRRTAYNKQSV